MWEDSIFPDADDSTKVGWMIMYWRTVKSDSGYRLESRQFDHLEKFATEEEANIRFNQYVENRRYGKNASVKNLTLFLCQVTETVQISDKFGEIISD